MDNEEMVTKVINEIKRDAQIGGILHSDKWADTAYRIVKLFAIPAVIKSVCDVKKWGETCTLTPSDKCCSRCSHYVKQTVL